MSVSLSRRQAIVGAGAFTIAGCARDGGGELRAVDTHPAGYPTVLAVEHMGRILARRSGGRLTIRQFPGGQLGEEKDTLELTVFGGLDLNRVNLAPLNSIVPETVVPTLPFMFRSVAHMRRALAGPPGRTILSALEPHGLVGLCFYESGARGFYTARRPIATPADMRGLKIRVPNSDVYVAMVDALGADATPMGLGEVYQALLQGVIDGAENNWPAYESSRHFEAAPRFAPTDHIIAPEVLVMSRYRWDRLPEADRALVRQAAAESVPVMQALWDAREREARARLLAAGAKVGAVDRAAFERLAVRMWDRFLTTPALRRLAKEIRAMDEAPR